MADRDPIKRRAKPGLLLLGDDLTIAFSEPSALALIQESCGQAGSWKLPPEIEESVRAVLASCAFPDSETNQLIVPVPSLLVRVSRLSGSGGTFIALLLERETRRSSLLAATERFAFSKRETDVLRLLLRGISTGEAARELGISEATVNGYFKDLLRKTDSHSRAEMVAKVLGWDGDEDAPAV